MSVHHEACDSPDYEIASTIRIMPKVSTWQATKKTAKSTHIFDPPRDGCTGNWRDSVNQRLTMRLPSKLSQPALG